MEHFKQPAFKNFEIILVGAIPIIAFPGTYYTEEPSVILNFYYLPVLAAAYSLGQ